MVMSMRHVCRSRFSIFERTSLVRHGFDLVPISKPDKLFLECSSTFTRCDSLSTVFRACSMPVLESTVKKDRAKVR